MPHVSIAQIEDSINVWRNRSPVQDDSSCALCFEARILADVYGQMIFDGHDDIDTDRLTDDQRAALVGAGVIVEFR